MKKFKKGFHYETFAFTLAEVLITLTIIGVIAALTIPTLIKNYEKHEIEAKLQRNYALFNNATRLAINDYGPISDWDNIINESSYSKYVADGQKFFETYILPYIKIVKYSKYNGRLTNVTRTYADGSSNFYLELTGDYMVPHAILPDGTLFWFWTYGGTAYIYFDINGDKKPNIMCKDIFGLQFNKNRDTFKLLYDHGIAGTSCGLQIQQNGWKITENYSLQQ